MQYVNEILEGAYKRTQYIKDVDLDFKHGKRSIHTTQPKEFAKNIQDLFKTFGMVDRQKLMRPPTGQAHLVTGSDDSNGSETYNWAGQRNLPPILATALFHEYKCLLCQQMQSSKNDHYLTTCKVTKDCGYTIEYSQKADKR